MAAEEHDGIEIAWNGHDLPTEMVGLPPGRYRLEPAEGWDLTPEEEAGLEEAAAAISRGEGVPAEAIAERLRQRIEAKGRR